jgi:hypothetical protein
MWHYLLCCHYSMCWLVFLSWNCLHHTKWSLDTHTSLIWSSISKKINAMDSTRHFLHIYRLDFPLEEIFLLSKFYGVTSFSKYPLVEIIIFENQDDPSFLWDLGLWILTTWPFHSYSLACCRPIHLISIENIDNNYQKTYSSPSIVVIFQPMWSLWVKFFLQTIRIISYKILQLKNNNFILIFIICANKYIFEAWYSPKLPWNF